MAISIKLAAVLLYVLCTSGCSVLPLKALASTQGTMYSGTRVLCFCPPRSVPWYRELFPAHSTSDPFFTHPLYIFGTKLGGDLDIGV